MNRSGSLWGACFVVVGLFALLVDAGVWAARPDWVWPLLLMVLGAVLLAGGLVPVGRRGRRDV